MTALLLCWTERSKTLKMFESRPEFYLRLNTWFSSPGLCSRLVSDFNLSLGYCGSFGQYGILHNVVRNFCQTCLSLLIGFESPVCPVIIYTVSLLPSTLDVNLIMPISYNKGHVMIECLLTYVDLKYNEACDDSPENSYILPCTKKSNKKYKNKIRFKKMA